LIIGDEDIRSIAEKLGCTFADEHRKFLSATASCNLHACPGSGKTTLLVAKLAILARKWPWSDRGILVLSHTNVARREVEQRLANEPAGARLLGYPHFVGTIQAFVDRFLALPYLRDNGEVAPRIDDDLFATRASGLFLSGWGWRNCKTARNFLRHRHDGGRSLVESLHYTGPTLAVGPASLPKAETASGRELRRLKDVVSKEGIFRFADMFAFATAALAERPYLREAVRHRFPWVFVDEMQDTSHQQAALLDGIFGGAPVVFHKIGDQNQSIFAESTMDTEQATLSWSDSIDLPQSQRLAPKLAALVSSLAVVHPQKLVGNGSRQDRAHTVFLFDDASISGVLPAFGTLIVEQWGDPLPPGFVAKAVGFRRKPTKGSSIPGSLGDYWAGFVPAPSEERAPRTTLLAALCHARQLASAHGEFHGAHRLVFEALARMVELHEGSANGRVTRRTLLSRCEERTLDENMVRALISDLLRTDCTRTSTEWAKVTDSARAVLQSGARANSAVAQYIGWEESSQGPQNAATATAFVYRSGNVAVEIEMATIHAVKGETHDATLVLETQFYEHDVRLAMPLLAGGTVPEKKTRFIEQMKRLYVGCTRPKELLCIAVHKSHLGDGDVEALRKQGWVIQTVPGSSERAEAGSGAGA